jgi:hypothetical protein
VSSNFRKVQIELTKFVEQTRPDRIVRMPEAMSVVPEAMSAVPEAMCPFLK